MKRTASAIAAAVATVLLVPGGASAATYCVEQPACTGTAEPSVQTALTAAAISPVPDQIEIGPGSFFSDAGYIYVGAGAANTVDVVGAGTDLTELRGGKAIDKRPTLLLQGSAPAHVSRLTVTALSPSNPLFTGGLRIFGAADHVAVTTEGNGNGVELLHGSSLSDSEVSVAGHVHGVLAADGTATVRDTSIEARSGGTAASALGTGKLAISHSRLNGNFGVRAENGASVTIDDSLVLASDAGLYAFDGLSKHTTVDAINTTIYGTDPSVTGARAYALSSGDSAQINLTSSVVAHVNTSLAALSSIKSGDAAIVTRFSAYDQHSIDHTGTGSLDQGTSNLDTTAPGFVDAANHDFRLAAGSPLRDAAEPSPAGGLAATDLAGNPRSVDGNGDGTSAPDIGAFEFQPPAAVAQPPVAQPPVAQPPVVEQPAVKPPLNAADPAPSILSASLTHRRFKIGRRATAFRIKLSEDAHVKISIRRATLKRAAHKGANRIAFSGRIGKKILKPGRYTAKLTATDAAGQQSKPRTLRFTVARA